MPVQHVLVCQEHRIPLPEGVTVVGRAIGCGIRFNTATVSRQHLILTVRGDRLTAESLSTTTGTLINGRRMSEPAELRHGDRISVGPHLLVIDVVEGAVAGRLAARRATSSPDADDYDEDTIAGEPAEVLSLDELADQLPPTKAIRTHTCPSCRARVAFTEAVCRSCGHAWGATDPSAITGRITMRHIVNDVRQATEPAAAVPVIYASDEMTIDVTVSEMDQDGLFVPTELLDPVGTTCELTVLPDGHPAVTFHGQVRRVRASADTHGPAGLFIHFTEVSEDAGLWLVRRLRQLDR